MIFLGVEQAPRKIQFANTNYRHFAIKTAICRVANHRFLRRLLKCLKNRYVMFDQNQTSRFARQTEHRQTVVLQSKMES